MAQVLDGAAMLTGESPVQGANKTAGVGVVTGGRHETAVPSSSSSRSAGLRIPASSGTTPGSNPPQAPGCPSPDHQPLARPVPGGWTAGCMCGWSGTGVYQLRAEALVMARAAHDQICQ